MSFAVETILKMLRGTAVPVRSACVALGKKRTFFRRLEKRGGGVAVWRRDADGVDLIGIAWAQRGAFWRNMRACVTPAVARRIDAAEAELLVSGFDKID